MFATHRGIDRRFSMARDHLDAILLFLRKFRTGLSVHPCRSRTVVPFRRLQGENLGESSRQEPCARARALHVSRVVCEPTRPTP